MLSNFIVAGLGALAGLLFPRFDSGTESSEAPIPCQGCEIVDTYPAHEPGAGMEYVFDEEDHQDGECDCLPTCKKETGCSAYYQVTITDYGTPGITHFSIGFYGPRTSIGDSVFYPSFEGDCDQTLKQFSLYFYTSEDVEYADTHLFFTIKCEYCAGTC